MILGEKLLPRDLTECESSFEMAKKMISASLFFPLFAEGEHCACRLEQSVFDWRGSGRCKLCRVRDATISVNQYIQF